MKMEVHADAQAVARAAAKLIALEARAAVAARGRFVMAVSGSHATWLTLRALLEEDAPWKAMHVAQVDERVAPAGHFDRHLTHAREILRNAPLRADQIVAMPVDSPDLPGAAEHYRRRLEALAGVPAVLDLVQLGLGSDGHTASLVPGDPVCGVATADVAITDTYQGRRRLTLTYPILERSRCIVWLVTGSDKAAMLARLRDGDRSIPAGCVSQERALALADRMAAGEPGPRY